MEGTTRLEPHAARVNFVIADRSARFGLGPTWRYMGCGSDSQAGAQCAPRRALPGNVSATVA